MYRAKAILVEEDLEEGMGLDYYNIPNEDGWLTGYLVDEYMVGRIADVGEECFMPEWWWPIDPKTVELIEK